MEKRAKNGKEYYSIDMLHVLRTLWHRVWIIILAGIVSATIGFSYSAFVISPDYSSSILLYVNNSSINLGNTTFSISASDISASQSLVKTYTELLKNRTTLERVIDKSGVKYTYIELYGMIEAESSHETEIMKVTVTGKDPYEVAKIANCIAEVLPVRISEIIDGASMEIVDSAIPHLQKVAPSITKHTAVGMIIGVLISAIAIVIAAVLDDTIHNEEYVLQTYDYPILAKVPNLLGTNNKRRYGKYGYYYQKRSSKTNNN